MGKFTPKSCITLFKRVFSKSISPSLYICVGVDDLYTDPQMHTVDMSEYGEANLGTKGMALFFSSHLCSPLCATLGLTQFDLSSQVHMYMYS